MSSPYCSRHLPPLSAFQLCLSSAGLPGSALPSLLHARPKCQADLGCLPLDVPQDFTLTSTASFLRLFLPALRFSGSAVVPHCCVSWARGLASSWLSSSTFLPESSLLSGLSFKDVVGSPSSPPYLIPQPHFTVSYTSLVSSPSPTTSLEESG